MLSIDMFCRKFGIIFKLISKIWQNIESFFGNLIGDQMVYKGHQNW